MAKCWGSIPNFTNYDSKILWDRWQSAKSVPEKATWEIGDYFNRCWNHLNQELISQQMAEQFY